MLITRSGSDSLLQAPSDRFNTPPPRRHSGSAPARSQHTGSLQVGKLLLCPECYFEGIDSERGIAWRATDSGGPQLSAVGREAPPDHSTIARTRRLIDLETHRKLQARLYWRGVPTTELVEETAVLKGKTIAIDPRRFEANAADAQHRPPGHRRELPGVSGGSREGLGDRDAHARGSGATGSEAEEEDLEQRLDEPPRSRCEGHEDERWPHASGAQSRACRRTWRPARLSR